MADWLTGHVRGKEFRKLSKSENMQHLQKSSQHTFPSNNTDKN
jgi:hypothetical protein